MSYKKTMLSLIIVSFVILKYELITRAGSNGTFGTVGYEFAALASEAF